jgi:site-specific recombinase XerD
MTNKININTNPYRMDDSLSEWMEAFLADRRIQGLAHGTLRFYQQKLKLFSDYCATQSIDLVIQITADLIRQYLACLEQTSHNPGGKHAAYRALRAFLNWYENEAEPVHWANPIRKGTQGPTRTIRACFERNNCQNDPSVYSQYIFRGPG